MQKSTLENNPDPARIARLILDHATLVADRMGEVAGFADAFATFSADGAARWEIDLIGVDPQWQGRGIARQLIIASLTESRRQNINFSRALIRTDNRPSQRAFAWCGFRPQPLPLYLYVAEPADLPAPDMPREAHIVTVDTLIYSGAWIEGRHSPSSFLAARALIYRQGRTTAGALIPASDVAAIQAAEQADYMLVGEYDWWERAISVAV